MTSQTHNETGGFVCSNCGNDKTKDATVDVTMRTDGELVLIEKVPARVCTNCEEQYYDDWASARIRQLIASGFPKSHMVRQITVPVYTIEDERPGIDSGEGVRRIAS